MTIINILGGLGNQMFQYAFAYSLFRQKNYKVKLDVNGFETYDLREYELNLFNTSLKIAEQDEIDNIKYKNENLVQTLIGKIKRQGKVLSDSYYKEAHFNFDENAYKKADGTYFEGYWQSERYFLNYREDLLKEFTLKKELHAKSKDYENEINEVQSVSLHIRRGDYVTNTHTNSVHGTCSLEYYKNAVKEIETKVEDPHFFIFSDDLAWAKDHLEFIDKVTFVELDKTTPDHEEMILMSLCKHNIIANSSFSWWGAWLNQNDDKMVIAPKKWFADETINTNDLIPSLWIRL
jgi:hypothetical protein